MTIKEIYVGEIVVAYKRKTNKKQSKILSSTEAEAYIRKLYPKGSIEHIEQAGALFFNSSNEIIGHTPLSQGGIASCMVDPRVLFQRALLCNSVAFIFFHNHPSGNTRPSAADNEITEKLSFASKVLDIKMLDSLIITRTECVSIL